MYRHFAKEDSQKANELMKDACHHNHHGDANQNHGDCHLIPVRMAVTNMPSGNGCWRGCGEKEALHTAAGLQAWSCP